VRIFHAASPMASGATPDILFETTERTADHTWEWMTLPKALSQNAGQGDVHQPQVFSRPHSYHMTICHLNWA
jgi:hypothetical protein